MKFEKIILLLEKYESLDIIAASVNKPITPTETTQDIDPYSEDKW